ncbi:hypothetical protein P3X46_006398 [Hevea brasiliensis]|uniref:Uncharacterized protein n=1 Tax=Hevea brasiliensis TaxID=3981 RepID=A0ABQ9MSG5_HEVBR|nr:UPF0481 protein At3g47200-like [Hevea brasiliensis]KAJ9182397.1 hypothetical protein P3X46_006398 [Hevea brasiliensis]
MAIEDPLTIRINKKLRDQCHVSSDCCIFKVPSDLRSVNEKAYEPQMIAIGPYHHGKDHLIAMEEHKIRYLQSFLRGGDKNDVSRYVQLIRGLEESARKCYAEPFCLPGDAFVEMLLLDGCFIIEFIFKLAARDVEDPIIGSDHKLRGVMLDLLLLENQLPFFILRELLVTRAVIQNPENNFIGLILSVYDSYLPGPGCDPFPCHIYTPEEMTQIKNLLGLLHDYWKPSRARIEAYSEQREHVQKFIRCATELKEAGIKFKSVKGCNLFDIKFEHGRFEIPKIEIADNTELVLLNLIAYEQLTSYENPYYFTDYMVFMDCLIDSAKDVELLCRREIIVNRLGDDETLATLFNKIGKYVVRNRVLYADIAKKVDEHCKKRRNLWMAKLRHDYFNTPWALISVLAAIMLLLLTWTQTVYSVLSYYK